MRWPGFTPASTVPPGSPALLLDRDGVLIVEKDYLSDPDGVELVPGAADALRQARAAGFLLIGVSNQSGIGRGRFTVDQFDAVMQRLVELLAAAGAELDDFYYCPHGPDEGCRCRKPAPGLLQEAAEHHDWDAGRSWVVGDKVSDVDLAVSGGLRPLLVRTGHGREQEPRLAGRPEVPVCDDLPAAVRLILEEAAR